MTETVSDAVVNSKSASEDTSPIAGIEALPGDSWSREDCIRFKEWLFRQKKESLIQHARNRLSYSSERQDAEDAWSDFSIEKLDHVLARYDPLQGSPYSWILLKFDFFCRNLNRHSTARVHTSTASIEEVLIDVLPVHDPRRAYEALDLLQAAMKQLAKEERHLFISRYIQEESYIELARRLEVPIGTIRSRLSALRRKIKRSLHVLSIPRSRP